MNEAACTCPPHYLLPPTESGYVGSLSLCEACIAKANAEDRESRAARIQAQREWREDLRALNRVVRFVDQLGVSPADVARLKKFARHIARSDAAP
jgi:hypothetical protein